MRISVFGIGYVGVVSCGCLAELGHEIIGVDVSPDKIAMLAAGRSPIVEELIDTLIAGAVKQGRLTATDDVVAAVNGTDVSFISVGTPSAADGSVALGAVENVIRAIGACHSRQTGATYRRHALHRPARHRRGSDDPAAGTASGRRLGDGLSLLQQSGIPARRLVGPRLSCARRSP